MKLNFDGKKIIKYGTDVGIQDIIEQGYLLPLVLN